MGAIAQAVWRPIPCKNQNPPAPLLQPNPQNEKNRPLPSMPACSLPTLSLQLSHHLALPALAREAIRFSDVCHPPWARDPAPGGELPNQTLSAASLLLGFRPPAMRIARCLPALCLRAPWPALVRSRLLNPIAPAPGRLPDRTLAAPPPVSCLPTLAGPTAPKPCAHPAPGRTAEPTAQHPLYPAAIDGTSPHRPRRTSGDGQPSLATAARNLPPVFGSYRAFQTVASTRSVGAPTLSSSLMLDLSGLDVDAFCLGPPRSHPPLLLLLCLITQADRPVRVFSPPPSLTSRTSVYPRRI